MKDRLLQIATAAACGLALVTVGATPAAAHSDGVFQPPPPPPPSCVVHNDSQPISGIGSYSVPGGIKSYSIGMDDFRVSSKLGCVLHFVDANTGAGTQQPAQFIVTIRTSNGVGGFNIVSQQTVQAPVYIGGPPPIEHLVLPTALNLAWGTYYVSVMAVDTVWYWQLNLAHDGDGGRWYQNRDPSYGCYNTWGYLTQCALWDLYGYSFSLG